jgi:hypothetical protein
VAAVLATHEPPVIALVEAPSVATVASPVVAPKAEAAAAPEPRPDDGEQFANLSADLMLGRARILVVAGVAAARDGERLVDRLVADALRQGLSVASVDAGSGRPSAAPGMSDLAAGEVSYGDVVQDVGVEGLAEVPWGQRAELDLDSSRPVTLIEALSDLYEIVVVFAGRFVSGSVAERFAVLNARLVLAGGEGADPAAAEVARGLAAASGYRRIEAIAAPHPEAEVA